MKLLHLSVSHEHNNLIFGFEIKCCTNNIDPHIKYKIRLLNPHQYATMSWNGIKVGPTSQTQETMRG
jgi:hypothetical protein